jgi:hypothetical protein
MFPIANHFHVSFFSNEGSLALLLAETPPSRVDVSIFVYKDALSVSAVILPITLIFSFPTFAEVLHLA